MHLEARRWWSRVPLLGVTFRKRLLWENFVCFFLILEELCFCLFFLLLVWLARPKI
jgi:hypothetical protein